MSDLLQRILAIKAEEVAAAKALKPLTVVRAQAEADTRPRDFVAALRSKLGAGTVVRIRLPRQPQQPKLSAAA